MPNYDFKCMGCGKVFEAVSHFDSETQLVAPVPHSCGSFAGRVWISSPGVRSTERLPAELKSRMKEVWGIDCQTRDEHDAACKRLGVVPDFASFEDTKRAAAAATDADEIPLTSEEKAESVDAASETWERARNGTLSIPVVMDATEVAGVSDVLPSSE